MQNALNTAAIRLSPVPRDKVTGGFSPDLSNKRRKPDGMRHANDVEPRARGLTAEVRVDITPDGGSAGREGRQFTVANVGNNGRIYLR